MEGSWGAGSLVVSRADCRRLVVGGGQVAFGGGEVGSCKGCCSPGGEVVGVCGGDVQLCQ